MKDPFKELIKNIRTHQNSEGTDALRNKNKIQIMDFAPLDTVEVIEEKPKKKKKE